MSAAAAAMLLLAGCSNAEEPTSDADGTGGDSTLCDAPPAAGDAIDAVDVSGEVGEPAEVSIDAPIEAADFESTILVEGEGEPVEEGQSIVYAGSIYDGDSGELITEQGYEPGTNLPAAVASETALGMALGCATPGTRAVLVVPGQSEGETSYPSQVFVLDFLEVAPSAAWGEDEEAPDGFPEVELGEDGAPTVTVPDGFETPDETELATLKQGDGAEVEDGDTVYVQYAGVKASDGTEFDSSWSRGAPTQFSTGGVIEGFTKALVGQKVGSQVIAVIPPEEGYGASEGHELQDETLIFVVDILGTAHAQPAAE
ncbi:FKBP-type peptidyl-prolyl cis-trans isomerase [Microbacterium sp. gxy059]|uniref:FKBP-type peptidyl-prolyl cis-trans isomerase n=1 Tax=Microbacterium sp. gxy059 TaxID=2957199 RepID=UPI003D95BD7F